MNIEKKKGTLQDLRLEIASEVLCVVRDLEAALSGRGIDVAVWLCGRVTVGL